ncbi:hypothetical protein A3K55_00440 [Candidatus Shapirobacteria bacterium RBG_13_44_7]|uniref:Uncharacterized protein n=1 Tax=Candidatus Shapirobacteria bacterium RBG_13_44_7 TaxID=1802149 RepID=A0A1F7SGG6_9BACT|nr:MAG: hypothetical protein A3K55_00440 [Candidatus Shapirobacteria bacterium RBG_13_44_7]
MRLSTKIIILLFLIFFGNLSLNLLLQSPKINPFGSQNYFLLQLDHALKLAQLDNFQINYRDFAHQVELTNNNSQIIFSTQKNPYWQVASLQQILKIAKIKDKNVKLVDLSITHPYVSFQNN